jgi:D-arabinose 1-dehydrogenase-like Zn-dependent alcohol dehydrogenase
LPSCPIGLGGLGHLAIQFASKSGFNTVGIGRGRDKEEFAKKLGASHYIDTAAQDPAAELLKLGGAKVILATVTSADAMKAVIGGLAPTGTLMIVGAVPSLEVPALQLLLKSQQVKGWYSGTSLDSQETLGFSVLSGVRSMNESYPLERFEEAYKRMEEGKARFRVVLTME